MVPTQYPTTDSNHRSTTWLSVLLGDCGLTQLKDTRVVHVKVDSFLPHQQALLAVNDDSFFTQDTSRIVKLIRLRWVALFAQVITLLFTQWGLDVDLPLLELGSCVLILGVSNLLLSLHLPQVISYPSISRPKHRATA